jgi:hypothetical protein
LPAVTFLPFPAARMIQEVGVGGARGGGWQQCASWGPDLLPFFLGSGVRWWLVSGDPSPLPFSYIIFIFAGAGGARTGHSTQGQHARICRPAVTLLPFPSPTSSSFL